MTWLRLLIVFVTISCLQAQQFPAPVEQSGQTTSYQQGDDGDLREGVPWPVPRFSSHGDGTVTDNLTELMWMEHANPIGQFHSEFDEDEVPGDGKVTWVHALDFATAVNQGVYSCGVSTLYTDWRLPNVREFASLIDHSKSLPALCDTQGTGPWSQGDPFSGVQSSSYWTSTYCAHNTNYAFRLYLGTGAMHNFVAANDQLVWLVRGNPSNRAESIMGMLTAWPTPIDVLDLANHLNNNLPPAIVERTGQVQGLYQGDDGNLEIGAMAPTPRFEVFVDGTVWDHKTGLVWTQNADPMSTVDAHYDQDGVVGDGAVSWSTALAFVAELNDPNGSVTANVSSAYTEWRLPNIRELESLLDYGFAEPCLSDTTGHGHWSSGDPFSEVHFGAYWSSTTNAGSTHQAWFLSVNRGSRDGSNKSEAQYNHVWPVMGPFTTKTDYLNQLR